MNVTCLKDGARNILVNDCWISVTACKGVIHSQMTVCI